MKVSTMETRKLMVDGPFGIEDDRGEYRLWVVERPSKVLSCVCLTPIDATLELWWVERTPEGWVRRRSALLGRGVV
jgi:hypothetical protein